MLNSNPTKEMVLEWKMTFDLYRNKMLPNRKKAQELIEYLVEKYPVSLIQDPGYDQVVIDNIIMNDQYSKKLKYQKAPTPVIYLLKNEGLGKALYDKQDDLFTGSKIVIGIDTETGYFLVEGSSCLWDELFAFRGLDADDLKNYYLVAEYINCLKKYDQNNELLKLA